MTDMKCPICKRNMHDYSFGELKCEKCNLVGDEELWELFAKSRELVKKLRKKNRILTNSVSEYFSRWMNTNIEAMKLRDWVKHYRELQEAQHQLTIDKIKGGNNE